MTRDLAIALSAPALAESAALTLTGDEWRAYLRQRRENYAANMAAVNEHVRRIRMQQTLPALGTLVTIVDEAHPRVGESGKVVSFHGVLHDSVFVKMERSDRDLLIPASALAWEAK